MKTLRIQLLPLLIASGFLLQGCASGPGPQAIRPLVAAATAATIQYAIPKEKKAEVAKNTVAAGNLYDKFSSGHVPTPDQFKLALDTYLPNNPSKVLTETSLLSLYSAYYPQFKDKIPQLQLDYLTNFLLGARDGATPFIPQISQ